MIFTWFAAAEGRVRGHPLVTLQEYLWPIICPFLQQSVNVLSAMVVRAANERSLNEEFRITEKAPTRFFFWLKALSHLRHFAH